MFTYFSVPSNWSGIGPGPAGPARAAAARGPGARRTEPRRGRGARTERGGNLSPESRENSRTPRDPGPQAPHHGKLSTLDLMTKLKKDISSDHCRNVRANDSIKTLIQNQRRNYTVIVSDHQLNFILL